MVSVKQTIPLQICQRLSSTNFTWSIFEYFVPNVVLTSFKIFDICKEPSVIYSQILNQYYIARGPLPLHILDVFGGSKKKTFCFQFFLFFEDLFSCFFPFPFLFSCLCIFSIFLIKIKFCKQISLNCT